MEMSPEERQMWEAVDRNLPTLRKLVGEMRTRGEEFTADALCEITDDLSGSRPTHVGGVIQRVAA
jgi:hypothetical protein